MEDSELDRGIDSVIDRKDGASLVDNGKDRRQSTSNGRAIDVQNDGFIEHQFTIQFIKWN